MKRNYLFHVGFLLASLLSAALWRCLADDKPPGSAPQDPKYIHVDLGAPGVDTCEGGQDWQKEGKARLWQEVKSHRKTELFMLEWSEEVLGTQDTYKYWYNRQTHHFAVYYRHSVMDFCDEAGVTRYANVDDSFVVKGKY